MPKICYQPKNFHGSSLEIIEQANDIIALYQAQGYSLTLRQLYYQFVSRDLLTNTQKSYSRLGGIINDARLAGLIDWEAIEDRTRNLHRLSTWDEPSQIISSAAHSYRTDKWSTQSTRIEVWIEKEALAGVFQRICDKLEVPFFACRGYTSQSEMWRAAQRLIAWENTGYKTLILHFGDHDPSGIDMSRDIEDRMVLFGSNVEVRRIALNMGQVQKYNPPPNPAKMTDSRFSSYMKQFGDESWELDALEPNILAGLVSLHVLTVLNQKEWDARVEQQEEERKKIRSVADDWNDLWDIEDQWCSG